MAKEIAMKGGHIALVDDEHFEWLNQWKWYRSTQGYAVRTVKTIEPDGRKRIGRVYMHRQIMSAPCGTQVDHRNSKKLDNCIANLRICDNSQNHRNMGKGRRGASKFKGVSRTRNGRRWCAFIKGDGPERYIGTFNSEADAALAYNFHAVRLHGEFARFNIAEEMAA